jgi:hypothetical protein
MHPDRHSAGTRAGRAAVAVSYQGLAASLEISRARKPPVRAWHRHGLAVWNERGRQLRRPLLRHLLGSALWAVRRLAVLNILRFKIARTAASANGACNAVDAFGPET